MPPAGSPRGVPAEEALHNLIAGALDSTSEPTVGS